MEETQTELLEMKIKHIPDAINSRLDTAREKFSKFKDIATETMQNATWRKLQSLHIVLLPQSVGKEAIFEDKMAQNFPKLMETVN